MGILDHNYLLSFQYRLAKLEGKGYGSTTYRRETKAIQKLLKRHKKDAPQLILDVGANVGNWTEFALKLFPKAKYYLFEPSRKSLENLEKRYKENPNIHIVGAALSNKQGEQTLYSRHEGDTSSSLYKRNLDHYGVAHNATYTVKTLTLDQFVETMKIGRIDILKMDVEGHELSVLEGAKQSLSYINAIQFEFSGCNIDSRTFFRDFWLLLNPNYYIYRIAPLNLIPILAYHDLHEYFAVTNYICIKKQ